MPLHQTRGAASAFGFGFSGGAARVPYRIILIGAGGGAGETDCAAGGFGGIGVADFVLKGNLSLNYTVGSGGRRGSVSGNNGYGGGGTSHVGSQLADRADGGGFTRLLGTGFDAIVGGGGGSAWIDLGAVGGGFNQSGSAGFDTNAGNATIRNGNVNAGGGGTLSAGGAGGYGGGFTGGAGSSLLGGTPVTNESYPGGCGGGGLYGGGAGGNNDGNGGGPGGGGSGILSITSSIVSDVSIVAATNGSYYTNTFITNGNILFMGATSGNYSIARYNPLNATYSISNEIGKGGYWNENSGTAGNGGIYIYKDGTLFFSQTTDGTGSITLTV